MKELMGKEKYNLLNHSCHVAYEVIRKYYGWANSTKLSYPKDIHEVLQDFSL
jgi:hypothetical protein